MTEKWQRLGWWWNGNFGDSRAGHRRDVWLEFQPAQRMFRVRWRGGEWTDRDGIRDSRDPTTIVRLLQALMGRDRIGWQEHVYLEGDGTLRRYDRPLETVDES